jgi:hypothetical protein
VNALEFVAALLTSWPLAFVVLCVLFRKQVAQLVVRISELTLPGGAGAKFREELQEALQESMHASEVGALPEPRVPSEVEPEPHVSETSDVGSSSPGPTSEGTALDGERSHSQPPTSNTTPAEMQAYSSPAGSVLAAWSDLERRIQALGMRRSIAFQGRPPAWLIGALHTQGVLDHETALTLSRLRKLRNEAAHLAFPDSISYADALQYVRLAAEVARQLDTIDGEG